MDAKLTLHFNKEVIEKAKDFAAANHISLSRLTEYLYKQITSNQYQSLEDLPISEWVLQVSEGEATYRTPSKDARKKEYYDTKK